LRLFGCTLTAPSLPSLSTNFRKRCARSRPRHKARAHRHGGGRRARRLARLLRGARSSRVALGPPRHEEARERARARSLARAQRRANPGGRMRAQVSLTESGARTPLFAGGFPPRTSRAPVPHAWTVELDHARGGWFARCDCGWTAPRATFYKARSIRWAKRHAEPLGESAR
jgi:hypothetical protein